MIMHSGRLNTCTKLSSLSRATDNNSGTLHILLTIITTLFSLMVTMSTLLAQCYQPIHASRVIKTASTQATPTTEWDDLQHVLTDAKLPTQLSLFAAVYDGDQFVYIVGGRNKSHTQDRILKYSIDSDTIEVDAIFLQVYMGAAIMYDECIIHFGGFLNGFPTTSVFSYSTVHRNYSVVGSLPLNEVNRITVAWDPLEEVAYLFGASSIEQSRQVVARYDPLTQEFEILEPVLEPVNEPGAIWHEANSLAYIFGDIKAIYRHAVLQFSPSENNVTKLATQLPYELRRPCVISTNNVDEQVYILGSDVRTEGLIRFNATDQLASLVKVNNWPHVLLYASCVYVPKLERLYIFGGDRTYNDSSPSRSDEVSYIQLHTAETDVPPQSTTSTSISTTEQLLVSTEATPGPPTSTDTDDSTIYYGNTPRPALFYWLAVGLPICILTGLLLCSIVFVYRRMRGSKEPTNQTFGKSLVELLSDEDVRVFNDGIGKEFTQGPAMEVDGKEAGRQLAIESVPYNTGYELARNDLLIDFGTKLGAGHYGIVYKGSIIVEMNGGPTPVAVKTVRPSAPIEYLKTLMSELKVLAYIGHHENIANLLGACSKGIKNGELFVAVEFCKTSLLLYLRDHSNGYLELEPQGDQSKCAPEAVSIQTDLMRWALEIAAGMEYVWRKRIVHGDLAARNVLLSFDRRAKICDFGLARQLADYTYIKSHPGNLPWKWMAIESLNQLNFSTKTDVWAYGVTLWEMFSVGNIPYPSARWNLDFINELMAGHRLPKPQLASENIYEKMMDCWNHRPEDRPNFSDLKSFFEFLNMKTRTESSKATVRDGLFE